jgi:hypothetical protein
MRPLVGFDYHRVVPGDGCAVSITVAVVERVLQVIEPLRPEIENIGDVYGMAPAEVLVMAKSNHW